MRFDLGDISPERLLEYRSKRGINASKRLFEKDQVLTSGETTLADHFLMKRLGSGEVVGMRALLANWQHNILGQLQDFKGVLPAATSVIPVTTTVECFSISIQNLEHIPEPIKVTNTSDRASYFLKSQNCVTTT